MLQSFFEWMQGLSFSNWILLTTWTSPILQCIHLLAICTFAGAVLIVDIRLLGKGLVRTPVADLARPAEKWLISSFVVLILDGRPADDVDGAQAVLQPALLAEDADHAVRAGLHLHREAQSRVCRRRSLRQLDPEGRGARLDRRVDLRDGLGAPHRSALLAGAGPRPERCGRSAEAPRPWSCVGVRDVHGGRGGCEESE